MDLVGLCPCLFFFILRFTNMSFKILLPAHCIIKLNKVKQVVNAFPMFSWLACKMTGRSGVRMPGTVAGWKYFPPRRTNIESIHSVFSFYFQFFVWGFLLDKQFLFSVDWLSFWEYWQGRNKASTSNWKLRTVLTLDGCLHAFFRARFKTDKNSHVYLFLLPNFSPRS